LKERQVAIVPTRGLHGPYDRIFSGDPNDFYLIIPDNLQLNDLVISQMATNFIPYRIPVVLMDKKPLF